MTAQNKNCSDRPNVGAAESKSSFDVHVAASTMGLNATIAKSNKSHMDTNSDNCPGETECMTYMNSSQENDLRN
eukprot:7280801-Karenia_brevis.AAC.1